MDQLTRNRRLTPAWRPDGAAIVAALAPDDETFNLVELSLDGSTRRQLTRTTGGARSPDISPDGTAIVFVGYTTDGDDLFTMAYPPDNVARTEIGDDSGAGTRVGPSS